MDEPTTYLDVGHQLEVMELSHRLAAQGRAVVLVLHDLPMALREADRLAVLAEGVLRRMGTPEEILDCGVLERSFHVAVERVRTEDGWRYYCRKT